jgi:hypothetical protein
MLELFELFELFKRHICGTDEKGKYDGNEKGYL